MLYEKYYKKMLKWSRVLTVIHRFRVLIISVSLAIIASLAAFMGVYGMVYDSGVCPEEIAYGEQFNYEASSLFTSVSYEYCAVGSDEWTSEYPQNVGDYKVRSVSVSIFGTSRYGTEYTFTILPKEVNVYVGVSSVIYGELPEVTADSLVSTDSVECTSVIYGDVTAANTSVIPDRECVTIVNSNGEDITSNYTFTCVETNISFIQREIEISTANAQKVYDGTPLTSEENTLTGGSLAVGDNLEVVGSAQITDVGVAENQQQFAIFTSDGKDVTSNYKITTVEGTLTINSRVVYLSTSTASFEYDGTEHSLNEYEIAESIGDDGLAEGHKADSISYYAIVTSVGEYQNEVKIEIADSDGALVTGNYTFIYNYGTLTVTPREITVITYDDEKVYDGTALCNYNYAITAGALAEGQSESIESYAQLTDVGSSENAVILGIYDGQSDVTANYTIIYEYATLTVTPREITVVTYDNAKIYDGTALYDCSYTITAGSIADGQSESVESYAQITEVGTAENAVVLGIYGGEVDVTSNYSITYEYASLTITLREITITIESGEKTYDGTALYNYAFEVTEGSIAEGQTANVETYAEIINVGSTENVLEISVHDGDIDVTSNYDITYINGTLTVTTRAITVTAGSDTKIYDGTALTCEEYTYENVVEGQALTCETSGEQINTGESANIIVNGSVRIIDADGSETTSNYEISYADGTLTVTRRQITVTAGSAEKVYDGTALTCDTYTSENVVEGQTLTCETSGEQLNAGESANIIVIGTVLITDINGYDTTENYEITYADGVLKVTPRKIVVTAGSAEKVYDGTALTCEEYTYENVVESQTLTCETSGEQINAGESSNIIVIGTVLITDINGYDTTANYEITYEDGVLKVTPRKIVVTAGSDTKIYDGTALTCVTYIYENVVEGQTLYATTSGEQINVGESANVIEEGSVIIYDGETDVTANYEITYAEGKLTVTAREITVTADSITREYDGTALTCNTCSADNLVKDHIISATIEGSQLDVGESVNKIVEGSVKIYDTAGNDVTTNYNITAYYDGTLTVTARAITVTAGSAEKEYDGTALTCDSCSADRLVEGHTISATFEGSQLDVGESDNKIIEGSVKIYDATGNDVTSNYEVTEYVDGKLTVTARKITITTNSDKKEYDGTALYNYNYTISEGSIVGGQSASVDTYAQITDVGSVENIVTLIITDSSGTPVTSNYEVTCISGTLTVTARKITITTEGDEKVYDGTALYNDGYTINDGSIAENQRAEVDSCTQITNVGSVENMVTLAISDADGNDVTTNYEVTCISGTLTVTARAITVTTYDKEWEYSGEALSYYDYSITDGSIAEGQSEIVETYAWIIDVGNKENTVIIAIYDGDNNNVTSNYTITYNYGTLTVTAREIIVTAGSDEKEYDGTALTCDSWTADRLVDGHTISATIEGSQMNAGNSANKIVEGSVKIYDTAGNDVTTNYNITAYYDGTLTVTKREIIVTAGSDTKEYDGTALTCGTYSVDRLLSEHELTAETYGSQTDVGESANIIVVGSVKIYDSETEVTSNYNIICENGTLTVTARAITVRVDSAEKIYDGTALTCGTYSVDRLLSWHEFTATTIGSRISVGTGVNKIDESSVKITDGDVDVTKNYEITYINGNLTVTKRAITIKTYSDEKVYDGTALYNNGYTISEGSIANNQKAEVTYYTQITDVADNVENIVTLSIYDGDDKDVTTNYEITYVNDYLTVTAREITVTADSATKEYDGTALTCGTCYADNLVEGHIITATLEGSQLNVGDSANIIVVGSVKIYDAAGNDVTTNYNITAYYGGTLKVTARAITVTVGSAEKEYDGTALTSDSWTADRLVEGHTISATIEGSQLDAGESKNTITAIKIYDAAGNEVTSNYKITCEDGALTVTKREIIVTAGSDTKEYDGTALTCGTYSVDRLLSEHELTAETYGSQTDVGESANIIVVGSVKIYDATGNDVTNNYEVTGYLDGLLKVTPREITITTNSKEKIYDGSALYDYNYEVTAGSIVGGQSASVYTYAQITDVGTAENVVVLGIYSDEVDVTSNYSITYEYATLTVTLREITITIESAEKVYDGTALYNDGYTISEGSIADNQTAAVLSYAQITDVGSAENVLEIAIYDSEGTPVTANYEVTYIKGTLTVTAREITVTADSAEKKYDGTALTCETYSVDNLVEGHTLTAETSGSQTDAGNSANKIVEGSVAIYDADGNETTKNYTISYANGTLTVTARAITVIAGSAKKEYDGTALTCITYTTYNLVSGHTLTAQTSGSQTEVGTSKNVIVVSSISISDGETEVALENYEITCVDGTLTVIARKITITTNSATKEYDGTALSDEGLTVSSGSLLYGHTYDVTKYTEITDVGSVENVLAIAIYDDNTDVTDYYEITYVYGTLTVTPIEITITTNSDSKEYDGTALSNEGCTLSGNLLAEHSISASSYAQLVDAGSIENTVKIAISDGTNDVTSNYKITYSCGTLTVTPRPITIQSASGSWLYDGLTHYENGYEITSGSLLSVHTIKAESVGITDIGTIYNTLTITITDSAQKAVTYNYNITLDSGTLTVYSSLKLSAGESFIYTAEANGYYTFTLEGGSVTITIDNSDTTLSQTGEANTVQLNQDAAVTITAITESEVTVLYSEEDPASGSGGSGSGGAEGGSGGEGGGSGGGLDTSGKICGGDTTDDDGYSMIVTSDTSGELYFRLISFGDYNGTGWKTADEYNGYIEVNGVKYSLNYLFSLALEEANYTATEITVELCVSDYVLPYYMALSGDGYTIQISDVSYSDSTGILTYTLNVYYYDYIEDGDSNLSLSSAYTELEQAYSQYVYDNYLSVPESTLEYLKTIIAEQGFDSNDEDIIAQVASYIQNAATYNLKYNTELDDETDIVVAFLRDYKEGICQHYASAATLLYRALGIPARYVLGYYATTAAGTASETGIPHAWVEVYINGLGWVQVEVTGSGFADGDGGSGGSGSTENGKLILKPVDEVKTYDGSELTAISVEGSNDGYTYLLKELLHLGYTYEVVFGGSQTDEGTSSSTITSFVLYNPDGSVCDDYTIEFEEGTLTVTHKQVITIYLFDYSKVYDGTALAYGEDDYYWLEDDYTVVIEGLSSISLTGYGIVTEDMLSTLTISVYKDGYNVTDDVYIKIDTTDILTIYRRAITVTSASASKVYDGTALTDGSAWISLGSLVSGDIISFEVTGSVTAVGKKENTIKSVTIRDSEGNDVTDNYLITKDIGTLEVIA